MLFLSSAGRGIKMSDIGEILTGKRNTMGIIETIKMIEREEGFEKGLKKGMEKGMGKGKVEEVRNLVTKLGLSDKQAADVAGVTTSFVKKVRGSIRK